jgi:hypothetical protein
MSIVTAGRMPVRCLDRRFGRDHERGEVGRGAQRNSGRVANRRDKLLEQIAPKGFLSGRLAERRGLRRPLLELERGEL